MGSDFGEEGQQQEFSEGKRRVGGSAEELLQSEEGVILGEGEFAGGLEDFLQGESALKYVGAASVQIYISPFSKFNRSASSCAAMPLVDDSVS
jgi:hypothetical protein